jgi:hypothetical protein
LEKFFNHQSSIINHQFSKRGEKPMATENRILDISAPANEDLSDYQYHFVVRDATANKYRLPDSAVEWPEGILQNSPESGEAAVVRVLGISKLVVNGVLAVGDVVSPEYVGATDAGKGSAGILETARGILLEASGAEDDLVTCMLTDMPGALVASCVISMGKSSVLSHVTSSAH